MKAAVNVAAQIRKLGSAPTIAQTQGRQTHTFLPPAKRMFVVASKSSHSRNGSEITLRPQCRRSPSGLTLISFASAAKVGSEPKLS